MKEVEVHSPGLNNSNPPFVIGIMNVTPDSFYDGGKYNSVEKALQHAQSLVSGGADILDLGGQSTRPGALPISAEAECERVIPVIHAIRKSVSTPISIDTFHSQVAKRCLEAGATLVNDVSGFHDPHMIDVIADHKASVIVNHMQGTPVSMQQKPHYENVVHEIYTFFQDKLERLSSKGISKEQIILDPGIGFGKNLSHHFEIFNSLKTFLSLGCSLMIGASRKSFIGKIVADQGPEDRLGGSLGAVAWAYLQGVRYFRVHDVKETKQALAVLSFCQTGKRGDVGGCNSGIFKESAMARHC